MLRHMRAHICLCASRSLWHVTFSAQPVKVSARQYCSYLMDWVQQQLDDEAVFPSQIGALQHLKLLNPKP